MSNGIVQENWDSEKVLQVNGIVFGSGDIILMDCSSLFDTENGRIHVYASPMARSTVASVLEFNPDPWVNVTVLATFNWSDKGLLLSCGEGAMGNEGFVAASDASSGQIRWVAFFNCSNPFIRVCAKDDNVVAENNHGHLWLFPRASPERVVISADPVEEPLLNKQPRD